MEWGYKAITIYITHEGKFAFEFNGKNYDCDTLRQAKKLIDEKTADFYKMSQSDVTKMLNKLNNKERTFVIQVISELEQHAHSAYCSIGISDDFVFECDFDISELDKK